MVKNYFWVFGYFIYDATGYKINVAPYYPAYSPRVVARCKPHRRTFPVNSHFVFKNFIDYQKFTGNFNKIFVYGSHTRPRRLLRVTACSLESLENFSKYLMWRCRRVIWSTLLFQVFLFSNITMFFELLFFLRSI